MKNVPPRLADKFLEWYCHPDLLEDLQGDLFEMYADRKKSGYASNAWYWWMVVRSCRYSTVRRPGIVKNSKLHMASFNLKIATRVLWNDRFNSGLNLLGLTIGIACFLLMGLYVHQETRFDQFHAKKDQIYRVWLKETYNNGNEFFNAVTPPRFEKFFEENFPQVEMALQYDLGEYLIGSSDNQRSDQMAIISPEFFEVFDFPILFGNKTTPLLSREAIVLSEEYARKYFGSDDPLGKTLMIEIGDGLRPFIVSAIYENPPISSSFQFGMAISNSINDELFGERYKNAWFSVGPETYVLVEAGTDVSKMGEDAEKIAMGLIGEARDLESYQFGLQPLTDIHLNPNIPAGYAPVANPQYVYILGLIGLLVLVIACINYATLAMAQSIRRGKEVGVRKVLGAIKPDLIGQYMAESILLVAVAMIGGSAIAIFIIPAFNQLTNSNLQFAFEFWHLGAFILGILVIGFIAGIYPAFILSNLRILSILGGRGTSRNNLLIRKGMVVFQFLITVFLISSTLIMRQQVDFLQNEDLGYSYQSALSVELFPRAGEDTTFMSRHFSTLANGELLKNALSKYPEISDMAMASHTFGSNGWANLVATNEDGTYWRFRLLLTEPNFISSFGIKLAEGRNFEEGNLSDERQGVILNNAAVKLFDLTDPIGKKLPPDNFEDHIIIGITEDFHYSSLHHEVDPLIIVQNPLPIFAGVTDGDMLESPVPKLMFTYNGARLSEAREILEKEWQQVFPNEEMNWSFLDERIRLQYENEARMNLLVSTATIMSIVIAMMGLIGLVILVVNSKVKEFGIRKVMGADTMTLFQLLSRSFALQIGLAILMSIPLTVWLMTKWLDNFAYRISIGPWVFIASTCIAVFVAGFVIFFHTIRASRINPIESLRSE